MEYEDIGIQSRKLSDVSPGVPAGVSACGPDDTSWKGRINSFLLNEAYGSVFLNMIADVLVRCIFAFIVPLLAFGYCQRTKSKKMKFSDQQLKQLIDVLEERGKALQHPDSNLCRSLEAANQSATGSNVTHCQDSTTAGNSLQDGSVAISVVPKEKELSQPSSDAGSDNVSTSGARSKTKIPKNGYTEMTGQTPFDQSMAWVEQNDAENILKILQMTPQSFSMNDATEPILSEEALGKRPVKADIRNRLKCVLKHLQIDEEKFMERGGLLIPGETSTSATSSSTSNLTSATSSSTSSTTASTSPTSEVPSVRSQPAATAFEAEGARSWGGHEHIMDIPILAVLPSSASLESGDKLKRFIMAKLGIKVVDDMYSSRILQAGVESTEEKLRSIREVAIEGMKIDKDFTLQIDKLFMYRCTGVFVDRSA